MAGDARVPSPRKAEVFLGMQKLGSFVVQDLGTSRVGQQLSRNVRVADVNLGAYLSLLFLDRCLNILEQSAGLCDGVH